MLPNNTSMLFMINISMNIQNLNIYSFNQLNDHSIVHQFNNHDKLDYSNQPKLKAFV